MAKRRRGERRVRIEGTLFPYDDAKQDVGPMKRELIDIWKGKRGVPKECMDAQCADRHRGMFPHPYFGIAVINSRAYVFDSPDHVVRYILRSAEPRRIHVHDAHGVAEPGEVMFYAPRKTERKGSDRRPRTEIKDKSRKPSNGASMSRGEKKRVLAAVGGLSNA